MHRRGDWGLMRQWRVGGGQRRTHLRAISEADQTRFSGRLDGGEDDSSCDGLMEASL